jgi:FlaA1/EpsC-like NDP-sugar epimerase
VANLILGLRNRHIFVLDILVLLFVPALALILRLDGLNSWLHSGQALIFFTVVALLVKVPIFHRLGLYNRYWRYASVNDLALVPIAVGSSTIVLTALFVGADATLEQYDLAMYPTVPLIDGLLTGLPF